MFAERIYRQRRAALAAALAAAGHSGVVLLVGQLDEPYNFGANPYPFRQDSSVLYYVGLDEPRLAVLLDIEKSETSLVADSQSEDELVWCTRASPESLQARCGADRVISSAEARRQLALLQDSGASVHLLPSIRAAQSDRTRDLMSSQSLPEPSIELIRAVVYQREVKTPEEISQIELALKVAAQMHEAARTACADGMREAELVGLMGAVCARQGARMAADNYLELSATTDVSG